MTKSLIGTAAICITFAVIGWAVCVPVVLDLKSTITAKDNEISALNEDISVLTNEITAFNDKIPDEPPIYNITVYAEVTMPFPTPEADNPTNMSQVEPSSDTSKEYMPLGTLRVTGYCGCNICCGNVNRPGGVVKGAADVELIPGVSAASSAALPFGTVVDIEGLGERVIQDRIAKWVTDMHGESIDIYFETHAEALEMGMRKLEVRMAVK